MNQSSRFVIDEAVDEEAVDVLLPCLRLTLRLDFLFFGMLLLLLLLLLLLCQPLNCSVLLSLLRCVVLVDDWIFCRVVCVEKESFEHKSATPITQQPLGIRY